MPTIVSRVLDGGRCLLDDLFKCQLLNLNQTSSRKPGVIVKEVLVIERHLDFGFFLTNEHILKEVDFSPWTRKRAGFDLGSKVVLGQTEEHWFSMFFCRQVSVVLRLHPLTSTITNIDVFIYSKTNTCYRRRRRISIQEAERQLRAESESESFAVSFDRTTLTVGDGAVKI